jgi:hypothetical protein
MKFLPSTEALALKKGRGEPIQAVANWTIRRRRFRAPSTDEACKAGIGIRFPAGSQVVRDEGLLFVKAGDELHAFTLSELGIG